MGKTSKLDVTAVVQQPSKAAKPRKFLPEHELPFQLADGEQPHALHTVLTPRYFCIELPAGALLFKGLDEPHSTAPCSKFDSNISWFANLDVASLYERRKSRPRLRWKGREIRMPCVWRTRRPLVLMDLTNVANMRNFVADLLQHVSDTYRLQRGREAEREREMQKVERQFSKLFGVNPLLGENEIDRNSFTDDDLYLFTNFCDVVAPRHKIDGYIAWPMHSSRQQWSDQSLFHSELMLCQPMSKIEELSADDERRLMTKLEHLGNQPTLLQLPALHR